MGEWIEWTGGECPIPYGTPHEVKFHGGEVYWDDKPQTWDWSHPTSHDDFDSSIIVAYRIVETDHG